MADDGSSLPITFSNVTGTQGPFKLSGGTFGIVIVDIEAKAPMIELQILAGDQKTWCCVADLTNQSYSEVHCIPGTYQLQIQNITGVYVTIDQIL